MVFPDKNPGFFPATETLSVKRAFSAIRRSDVVALVVEAMACVTEQVFISTIYSRVHTKQFI